MTFAIVKTDDSTRHLLKPVSRAAVFLEVLISEKLKKIFKSLRINSLGTFINVMKSW